MSTENSARAPRQPAEIAYRQVAELVRAGVTQQAAIEMVADREGRKPGTVSGAYYKTKARLEAGTVEKRTAGKASITAPAAIHALEANPGAPTLADQLEAIAAALVAVSDQIGALEADARRWRDIRAVLDRD